MTVELTPPDLSVSREITAHIVLIRPEIPQNTGSIARLCAGTGAWLHLVGPTKFILEDKYLKRAGLDYWPNVRLSMWDNEDELLAALPWERVLAFSAEATPRHWDRQYPECPVLIFGTESVGLASHWRDRYVSHLTSLPIKGTVRSLNLAQSVALAHYEGLRQRDWNPGA